MHAVAQHTLPAPPATARQFPELHASSPVQAFPGPSFTTHTLAVPQTPLLTQEVPHASPLHLNAPQLDSTPATHAPAPSHALAVVCQLPDIPSVHAAAAPHVVAVGQCAQPEPSEAQLPVRPQL
jgi:hypothetical protein